MENEVTRPRASTQFVLGLIVVGIGVLFLLNNLGIVQLHGVFFFWPLAFIGSGLVAMFSEGSRSSRYTGMVLVAVGVAMILNRMGLIYISWRTVWPLALIAMGGLILYRTGGAGRMQRQLAKDGGDSENVVDIVAILGGFERRVSSQDFRGGEITAVMGGCALDLRQAAIVKEAVINVFSFWGGITIKVPPGWTVVLHGTPIMGGFAEKTITPPDNSRRLIVTGYAIMGGIEVRN
jgi:predicted membrane protein